MVERNEKGYYRCRQRVKKLCDDMMAVYTPYITIEALRQVNHPWTTQKNEAMNTSVAAFAPKGKTYSMMNNLLTRVSIAARISIAGHEQFWINVATELGFTFDANFLSHLKSRDRKKKKSRVVQWSIDGKKRRSQLKYSKQSEAHKTQLYAYKQGLFYESSVTISLAKKTLKTVARNPKGAPDDQMRCPYYHPLYCTALAHKACSSPLCGMKTKSKVERAVALKFILAEQVDSEVKKNASLGMFYFSYFSIVHILF